MACTIVEMDGCNFGQSMTEYGCLPCGSATGTAPNGILIKKEGAITGQAVLNAAPGILDSIGKFIGSVTGKGGPDTVVYTTPPNPIPPKKDNTALFIIGGLLLFGGAVFMFLKPKKG